ncbi:TTM3 [Scenedesmus sp. PABB004]|nr:TTM3 [Scenedesmus sp. PABB004]
MEVEVKLRLPGPEAHNKLQQLLAPGLVATHQQENYFFDGPGGELNSRRVVLRLRFYDADRRAVLTLKGEQVLVDGIARASEEEETLPDAAAARAYLAQPSALLDLDSDIMRRLARQYGLTALVSLGGFENTRQEVAWEGFTLELDATRYEWGSLYELEAESDKPEALRARLEALLQEQGVAYSYSSTSKFANFSMAIMPPRRAVLYVLAAALAAALLAPPAHARGTFAMSKPCKPGTFLEAGACVACRPPFYCPGGAAAPKRCSQAFGPEVVAVKHRAASGVDACRAAPGWMLTLGSDAETPKRCPIGSTKEGWNNKPCRSCGPGFLTDGTATDDNNLCFFPPGSGTARVGGVLTVVSCGQGTYGRVDKTYSRNMLVECQRCPANMVTADQIPGAAATKATANAGPKSCLPVPGFFITSRKGVPVAAPCPAGSWSRGYDITRHCTPCPSGSTTPMTAATSANECTAAQLPPGFGTTGVEEAIVACPRGTWSAGGAPTPCTACAPGSTTLGSTSTSAAACSLCLVGHGSLAQGAGCAACPVDTFSDTEQAGPCQACADGFSAPAGAASAAQCVRTTQPAVGIVVGSAHIPAVPVPGTDTAASCAASCAKRAGCMLYRFGGPGKCELLLETAHAGSPNKLFIPSRFGSRRRSLLARRTSTGQQRLDGALFNLEGDQTLGEAMVHTSLVGVPFAQCAAACAALAYVPCIAVIALRVSGEGDDVSSGTFDCRLRKGTPVEGAQADQVGFVFAAERLVSSEPIAPADCSVDGTCPTACVGAWVVGACSKQCGAGERTLTFRIANGSTCTGSCNSGSSGTAPVATCQSGQWTVTTPAACTDGSTCTGSCNSGSSGTAPVATCQSGQWTVTTPAACTDGSTCTGSCNSGSSGTAPVATCQSGQWTVTTPAACTDGSTCTGSCNSGSSGTAPVATCQSGQWTVTTPAACTDGSTCTGSCNSGNSGTAPVATCQSGQWTVTTPAACTTSGSGNTPPTFTIPATVTAYEDLPSSWTVSPFITCADPVDAGQQIVSATVTCAGGLTFTTQPALTQTGAASWDLSFVVAQHANGVATCSVAVTDDASGTSGGSALTVQSFALIVVPVNDPPTFTPGNTNIQVAQIDTSNGQGVQYDQAWATNIQTGPADESGQQLTFVIGSNSNTALFGTQPAISSAVGNMGRLTFTTDGTTCGSAFLDVYLTDSGGTANGGSDTSSHVTLTIRVICETTYFLDFNDLSELPDNSTASLSGRWLPATASTPSFVRYFLWTTSGATNLPLLSYDPAAAQPPTGFLRLCNPNNATECALGSRGRNGTAPEYGVAVKHTGFTGTRLRIKGTFKTWWRGTTTAAQPELKFWFYKFFAATYSSIDSSTSAVVNRPSVPGSSSASNHLTTVSSTVTGVTAGPVDGDDAANQQTFDVVVTPTSSVASGDGMVFMVNDVLVSSGSDTDNVVGIDNLSFTLYEL